MSQRSKTRTDRRYRVVCNAVARDPFCSFVSYRTKNLQAPCPRCGSSVTVLR